MHKTKLLRLLKSLNKDEFKDLEDFLKSPYFNTRSKCVQLYEVIKKEYPQLAQNPKLDKEVVLQKLFPQSKPSALRELSSSLYDLVLIFLKHQAFEKKQELGEYLLLKEFNERKLAKEFYSQFQNIEKQQAPIPQSIKFYQQRFLSTYEAFVFEANLSIKTPVSNLHQSIQDFEVYTILQRLKLYCTQLNEQAVLSNKDFDEKRIEDFITFLASSKHLNIPSIHLYYLLLKLLFHKEAKDTYTQIKQQILKENLVSKEELKEILILLITYLTGQINAGDRKMEEDRFDWYYEMLKQGFLQTGSYVALRHLKNLVSLAVQQKKFILAEQLIKEYAPKVEPQYISTAQHYNLGALYFYQNKFKEAQKHLLQVEYIDAFLHFDSKALLLKMYYIEESYALLHLADASIQLVRRNKTVAKATKDAYLNFIKAIQKLYKLKTNPNTTQEAINAFIKSLKDQSLSDPRWIFSKAQELLKKF